MGQSLTVIRALNVTKEANELLVLKPGDAGLVASVIDAFGDNEIGFCYVGTEIREDVLQEQRMTGHSQPIVCH